MSMNVSLQMRVMDANGREKWSGLVAREPCLALLQSWEWGEFKEGLGWKALRLVAEETDGRIAAGAQLLIKPLPLGLSFAYVPRGPIGGWQTTQIARPLFAELCRLARIHGSILLKIEPPVISTPETTRLLESCGFHRSRIANQPRATILLDLTQGQDGVLKRMRKKTRQYVQRAQREGIAVRFGGSADLPAVYDIMRLTGRREHFATRSLDYYRSEWETLSANHHGALLLAYHRDQLIAVRVVYYHGAHAAEFHAGSVPMRGLHPNYLLVWEAVKWAMSRGCITYDLWGIPDELGDVEEDEDPTSAGREDGLWGVYQFKRGFGRLVVSYIGAYDYGLVPGLYGLLNSPLFHGKWWERIAAGLDSLRFGPPSRLRVEPRGEPK